MGVNMTKQWTAYVIVYHKFEVEGDTWDEAHEDAMEEYANALEHWANCFRDGTLYDAYANEIAYLLEDKAHDIRGDLKNEQTSI